MIDAGFLSIRLSITIHIKLFGAYVECRFTDDNLLWCIYSFVKQLCIGIVWI